jgi:regulator of protease activity HflC (stomatin/prohibitin superfamily)
MSESTIIGLLVGGGALLVLALGTFACGIDAVKPDAGHEAVLIEKPMIFGHGGVIAKPVKTGRSYVWATTDHVLVNMQPIQVSAHFDDLMSLDGVPLDFDAVVRLQVTDSVSLIKNFGVEWYKNNVDAELRNRVRQAVRKHGMNETAISTAAIEQIDNEISTAMEKYIVDAKLPLKLIQITVGKANPPDSIKNQRVETAAQQQRVLTEGQRKLAEDSRKAAELSRAEADNAYRNAMQLSPDQYLKLETIKMQDRVCGSGGCIFINGNATPIINTAK